MIPLVHDFADETVLVFGGGAVGARKARRFAREARVVVVSAGFANADFGGAERVRAEPDPDVAAEWVGRFDPALVVAATDDAEFNAAVADAAREASALVNRADRRGDRDTESVVVPATVRDDPVSVAVTTDGTSPAVSRVLRERFESVVADASLVADATADLRSALRDRDISPETRRRAVVAAAEDDAVWEAARDGDERAVEEAVREAARRVYER